MVPPWPTKEVSVGPPSPFFYIFFFLCVAQVWAIRDTKASYSNRFCTRFARDVMPATITQEMHIAKEASSYRPVTNRRHMQK